MTSMSTQLLHGGPSRAGQKLRQWRNAHNPPLSGEDAARQLGISSPSLYRIETGARIASDPIKQRMVEAGVCDFGDFFAPKETNGPEASGREANGSDTNRRETNDRDSDAPLVLPRLRRGAA